MTDEHTLEEVSELFNYLADHPTAAEILAAVYEVKPRNRFLKPDQSKFHTDFGQVPNIMGTAPQKPSKEFNESINFAEQMMRDMKLSN